MNTFFKKTHAFQPCILEPPKDHLQIPGGLYIEKTGISDAV